MEKEIRTALIKENKTEKTSKSLDSGAFCRSLTPVTVLFPSSLGGPTRTSRRGTRNRSTDSGGSDLQLYVILQIDSLTRIIVVCCSVVGFWPVSPLHRLLGQLDDRATILQPSDVLLVFEMFPEQATASIEESEGLKEGEKLPDEIRERRGLGELEIFEDHIMAPDIH